jgi:hypothetical protein
MGMPLLHTRRGHFFCLINDAQPDEARPACKNGRQVAAAHGENFGIS